MVRTTNLPPRLIVALVAVAGAAMVAVSILRVSDPGNRSESSQVNTRPSAPNAPLTPANAETPRTVSVRDDVVSVREDFRQILATESQPIGAETDASLSASSKQSADAAPVTSLPSGPTGNGEDARPDNRENPATPIVDQPRLCLPAAMLEPDESIGISSELQVAEWEQLQEDFVRAVNETTPRSKADRETWIRAQQENDDLFRQKFGWDAFQAQQLKAYREGLAPQSP